MRALFQVRQLAPQKRPVVQPRILEVVCGYLNALAEVGIMQHDAKVHAQVVFDDALDDPLGAHAENGGRS